MIEFIQLRRNRILHVPSRCLIRKLKTPVTGVCRKHPHGFINGKRVWGFWAAVKRGILVSYGGIYGDKGCGCCAGIMGMRWVFPETKVALIEAELRKAKAAV